MLTMISVVFLDVMLCNLVDVRVGLKMEVVESSETSVNITRLHSILSRNTVIVVKE